MQSGLCESLVFIRECRWECWGSSQMAVTMWLSDAWQGGSLQLGSGEELYYTDQLFPPRPPPQASAFLPTNGSFSKSLQ